MAVTDEVRQVLEQEDQKSEEFRSQLQRFKVFKQQLENAGIELGDRYDMPLMLRLGHKFSN